MLEYSLHIKHTSFVVKISMYEWKVVNTDNAYMDRPQMFFVFFVLTGNKIYLRQTKQEYLLN